jgi:nucleoside-diphosphate-sugar epimerase
MDETALERDLSEPTPALVAEWPHVPGDVLIVGAGGKMGPSLARLAVRASGVAGGPRRVVAVSRFNTPGVRAQLERDGVATVAGDLFDRGLVDSLPEAANVIFMAGRKFGTTDDESATWATNAWLPGIIADRFRTSRLVAFSTGNVYPRTRTGGAGPAEDTPCAPVGEYAMSALARERVLEFFSRRHATPMAILRLNYAVEPRYGVLRDLADRIMTGAPIDLETAAVNVIWQRDANAIALRLLAQCPSPPLVLNVTGPVQRVVDLANGLAGRLGRPAMFQGVEGGTALLSNAARCRALLGPLPTDVETMLDRVAVWVLAGGRTLQRPTHFDQGDGQF